MQTKEEQEIFGASYLIAIYFKDQLNSQIAAKSSITLHTASTTEEEYLVRLIKLTLINSIFKKIKKTPSSKSDYPGKLSKFISRKSSKFQTTMTNLTDFKEIFEQILNQYMQIQQLSNGFINVYEGFPISSIINYTVFGDPGASAKIPNSLSNDFQKRVEQLISSRSTLYSLDTLNQLGRQDHKDKDTVMGTIKGFFTKAITSLKTNTFIDFYEFVAKEAFYWELSKREHEAYLQRPEPTCSVKDWKMTGIGAIGGIYPQEIQGKNFYPFSATKFWFPIILECNPYVVIIDSTTKSYKLKQVSISNTYNSALLTQGTQEELYSYNSEQDHLFGFMLKNFRRHVFVVDLQTLRMTNIFVTNSPTKTVRSFIINNGLLGVLTHDTNSLGSKDQYETMIVGLNSSNDMELRQKFFDFQKFPRMGENDKVVWRPEFVSSSICVIAVANILSGINQKHTLYVIDTSKDSLVQTIVLKSGMETLTFEELYDAGVKSGGKSPFTRRLEENKRIKMMRDYELEFNYGYKIESLRNGFKTQLIEIKDKEGDTMFYHWKNNDEEQSKDEFAVFEGKTFGETNPLVDENQEGRERGYSNYPNNPDYK